jgi:hypothetical protein
MMRRTTALAAALAAIATAPTPARAVDWGLTLFGGYQGGGGGRLTGTASDLVHGVPLALSAGLGYTILDPGDALQARAVFINQNTNGTPEKSGHFWDFRLDLVYLFPVRGLVETGAFIGVRRSYFLGDFHYVGGNEDFEVTSNQWGWGFGVRGGLAMSPA